ncbi:MAG: diguanylate cyclase domain-containing protein [Burkholderiales bacterium]
MDSDVKELATAAIVNAPPLVTALNQSEQVKEKVEECAQELSSINEVLKHQITQHLPLEQVEQALHQSEGVENKVQECADDLSLVNRALGEEVRQRRKLERKLAESKIELEDTQAELSDIQVQEKHVRRLALHDAVTGLPNRNLLNDRLKHALAQARRHAWCLAVMFIDLDKFKSINDSYGHHAGDKVLKIISERLQASVREGDTVGRQGGDEFLYLMLEVNDEGDVANAARKIIETVAQPCEFDGLNLTVKPSIGIALYPQDGRSASVLLKNADSAMYKAKQSDQGYRFYTDSRGE